MNLAELRVAALAALAEPVDPGAAGRAAATAAQMALMVGWAIGPIDPRGEVLAMLRALCATARARFAADPTPVLAALHDALADLAEAIAAHDRDLEPADGPVEDVIVVHG